MPSQMAPLMPVAPQGLIDIDQFRAEIVRELHDQILAGISVHIDSPQIGAPNVRVDPQVTVEPATVDVTVSIPGIEALASQLGQVNNLLGQVISLLSSPETTTVTRGSEGITEMVKRRG